MAVEIKSGAYERITVVEFRGTVTMQDMLAAYAEALRNEAFRDDSVLLDFDGATLKLNETAIRTLAAQTPIFKCVAIYAPDLVNYGLARMFEMVSNETRCVAVFSNRLEALGWLQRRG